MTQTTKKLALTSTPVQITNGTNQAYLQINRSDKGDFFRFAFSDTMPVDLDACYVADNLEVRPPYKCWVWTIHEHSTVVYTVIT